MDEKHPDSQNISYSFSDNLSPNQVLDIQSYLNRLIAMTEQAEEVDLLEVSQTSSGEDDGIKKVAPKGRETRNMNSSVSARTIRLNQNFRNWLYLRTRRTLGPVQN